MFGHKLVAAALLLPQLFIARPNNRNVFTKIQKLDVPVAKYCSRQLTKSAVGAERCSKSRNIARTIQKVQSVALCSLNECIYGVKYDPLTALCQCNWGTADKMNEDLVWPGKNCEHTITCYEPYTAHWNPSTHACACTVDTFPRSPSDLVRFKPQDLVLDSRGSKSSDGSVSTLSALVKTKLDTVKLLTARTQLATIEIEDTILSLKSIKEKMHELGQTAAKLTKRNMKHKKQDSAIVRADPSDAISLAPLPTYIPPPNTEVTQELLEESLLIQPQQLATVGSVIPQFADGVITFLVQLDGPISQTLALNATDTLPCDSIGTQPEPSLILVPKTVKNGVPETVLPTCLVIAVNMYDPRYITYWVQKEDGSVFTLLSDNKIHAIDQIDTSQPASVAIRVASANKDVKRSFDAQVNIVPLERRQVFSVACDHPCPLQHMEYIKGSDGYCGCVFKSANQKIDLVARGVEQVNPYTAIMTAEACAAMTCINNGGKPALFNPFTATCWCASPAFVEENENAYNGGM